jgi:hypothetical protein
MKTFKVNENIEIVCVSQKTRSGFRHLATLIYNGNECETVKCTYQNRTWERYEFQSVLFKLATNSKTLSKDERDLLKDYTENYKENDSHFSSVALVAKMGDIFGQTKKASNDWKKRLLLAGLENKGLTMPDDWDTLSENEKEKRLNGVIEHLEILEII